MSNLDQCNKNKDIISLTIKKDIIKSLKFQKSKPKTITNSKLFRLTVCDIKKKNSVIV